MSDTKLKMAVGHLVLPAHAASVDSSVPGAKEAPEGASFAFLCQVPKVRIGACINRHYLAPFWQVR